MKSDHSRTLRAGLLGASALAALVLLAGRPSQAEDYGTIKGRLVWGGDSVPEAKVLVKTDDKDKKDFAVCTKNGPLKSRLLSVDPNSKGVADGFAFLVKPKGTNPEAVKALLEKSPTFEIDQKTCEFLPHSAALMQDQKVNFKSSDPVSHNVHWTGFKNQGNTAVPPSGLVPAKLVAEAPRPINLVCDIHPWMNGTIMVFDHPFFAVTGEDGSFEIKGVPAGEQAFALFHETVGIVTPNKAKGQVVKVEAGKTLDLGDIKLMPKK